MKVPVLFTHHFRVVSAEGRVIGAISDLQAERVLALVRGAGQAVTYKSFPQMGHSKHGQDAALFASTLIEWAASLPPA